MASVPTEEGESWSEIALANTIVLRRIFSYLPINTLNECSLVNQLWNFEARSHMRDCRRCDAKIYGPTPCARLYMLDQLVDQMSFVHYNGIMIKLGSHSATPCMEQGTPHSLYNNLLTKVPLKHLDLAVYWDPSNEPRDCPASQFVKDLLQKKLSELESLKFYSFPSSFLDYLGPDWTPWLPKLKVFDVATIRYVTAQQVEFLNKILGGCPNIAKLKGNFDCQLLGNLLEAKYYLLDNFRLYITSSKDEIKCLKLAQAKPRLSLLHLQAPCQYRQPQFNPSFFHVTEQLLSTSSKTLVVLSMSGLIFPLNRLTFPALINLETLDMTGTATVQQFLDAVNSIDYGKQMPRLKEVIVASGLPFFSGNDLRQPLVPLVALEMPPYTGQPSTTVEKLVLGFSFNVNHVTLEYFGRLFPNVKDIAVTPRTVDSTSIPYEALWSCWPHLRSIFLVERTGGLRRNFDAEFLGINPEEANTLRDQTEEFLDQLNLVPIRPSILTLLELKSFRIDFEQPGLAEGEEPPYSGADAFLSKATGILAVKRLRKIGISVNFMNMLRRMNQRGFTVTATECQY